MLSPLVSIILPTYNGKPAWLSEAIDSVMTQTYTNWELIIINDASMNNIEHTILEYLKKDKRVKYYKNKQNRERSYTKNKGISLSQGQYIAFIDDDDVWFDNIKLEKQVTFLQKNNDFVMVGCSIVFEIDEEGTQTNVYYNRTNSDDIYNNLLLSNQFIQSSIMARKNAIQSVGGFPLAIHLAEDYYLWLSLGIIGKMTNIESAVQYRNRSGNSSNTRKRGMFLSNLYQTFIFAKHYPGFWKALIKKVGYFILPAKISSILLKTFKKGIQKI